MERAHGQIIYPGLQKMKAKRYVYHVEMAQWKGKSSIEVRVLLFERGVFQICFHFHFVGNPYSHGTKFSSNT